MILRAVYLPPHKLYSTAKVGHISQKQDKIYSSQKCVPTCFNSPPHTLYYKAEVGHIAQRQGNISYCQ